MNKLFCTFVHGKSPPVHPRMFICRLLIAGLGALATAAGPKSGFSDCVRAHPELSLQPLESYKDMVCAQSAAPPGSVRVACVGDSITAGYGSADRADTYPAQLQAFLDEAHGEGAFSVTNLGLSGSTMRKGTSMPYWQSPPFRALVEAKWDIVIIMLGTNDAKDVGANARNWQPSCENWSRGSPNKCSFAEDYASLIDTVRALGTSADGPEIYTAIPPPLMRNLEDDPDWGMNQTVINDVYPDLLRRITREAGVLGPIDILSGLGGVARWREEFPDGGCVDGAEAPPACRWFCDAHICDQCHPTVDGYGRIASVVASHLARRSEPQRPRRGKYAASLRALSAL